MVITLSGPKRRSFRFENQIQEDILFSDFIFYTLRMKTVRRSAFVLVAGLAFVSIIGGGCSGQDYEMSPSVSSTQQPSSTENQTPPAAADSSVKIGDLTFMLPKGWFEIGDLSSSTSTFKRLIKVPDPKYTVVISMSVKEQERGAKLLMASKLLKTAGSGAKIYAFASPPALAAYEISYKDKRYLVVFAQPESNEPEPKDADGPWFPSTTVTEEQFFDFVATVK